MNLLRYSLIVGVLCLCLGIQAQHSHYNSFALHKMTDAEIVRLGEYLADDSISVRLGGEEIEVHEPLNLEIIRKHQLFSEVANVKEIHLLASGDYEKRDFIKYYRALKGYGVSSRISFKNEIWFEIEQWQNIRKDIWTYLFNREKYYQKAAVKYATDARRFQSYMASHGENVQVVLNIPLPQNRNFKAFNRALVGLGFTEASVHVYGKWKEIGYADKLDGWLGEIKSQGFKPFIGEHNGLANHSEGRHLKNSLVHLKMHNDMMNVYAKHGIAEVYQFTLVNSHRHLNWANPPIYHRFLVTDTSVIDELDKVYE